uniref:hypothetical protein n=1 Tax=Polaribacter sp. TaxID=1920175 RepID=UPI004048606C
MLEIISRWTVILFGCFILLAGCVMLLSPTKARIILRKAGSTNFINYAEISLRMIPAVAMILYADVSKNAFFLHYLGWIMFITSVILFAVPRKVHHKFSLKSAEILLPIYFRFIAPMAFGFGVYLIYLVF